jgi:hypothetical protein
MGVRVFKGGEVVGLLRPFVWVGGECSLGRARQSTQQALRPRLY